MDGAELRGRAGRFGSATGRIALEAADRGQDDRDSEAVAEEGLLVRPGGEYGLDGYVRVTVGPAPLMERVADALTRARSDLLDRGAVSARQ